MLITLVLLLTVEGYRSHEIGRAGTRTADGSSAASVQGPVVAPDSSATTGFESLRTPARTVVLTFDDGPDPKWTPAVLDVLHRHGVPGTFFVVGSRAYEHPELLRRESAQGNEIGLHTFTHQDLSTLSPWRRRLETDLAQQAIVNATGSTSRLIRPPYSSTPAAVDSRGATTLGWLAGRGYVTVLSDVDSRDWERPGVPAVLEASLPRPGSGAVVLMHDGGGNRAQTIAALDELIPRLQAQGYRFATVDDAFATSPMTQPASRAVVVRARSLGLAMTIAHDVVLALVWSLSLLGLLSVARALWVVAYARRHVRRTRTAFPPPTGRPSVSVVVPAYNEAAGIVAAVRSLAASDHPELEVLVVDDGSTDGTGELVDALRLPSVRVLRQANAGKPAALNTGIAAARGDILVLVDGDTVFEPDTVRRLLAHFGNSAVGAVAGNTKVANRGGLLGRWQHLEYVVGFNLDRRLYDELHCMPTVPGAIGAFRRSVLLEVGGVSEDTLAEDTDLTMAVVRAGWRVVYAEDAHAWTEAPATLGQLWKQRYRWCYGTLQAMWKHRYSVGDAAAGRRLGRIGLPYLLMFQVLLPLLAPVVDVYAVYGVAFLNPVRVLAVWLAFVVLQAGLAAYALRLDREPIRGLWVVPLQQFVYRQLMYLVVVESVVTALTGARLRWHKLHRTGIGEAHREVVGSPS